MAGGQFKVYHPPRPIPALLYSINMSVFVKAQDVFQSLEKGDIISALLTLMELWDFSVQILDLRWTHMMHPDFLW